MPCKKPCIGHVCETVPLHCGAWKLERTSRVAADGGIHGECDTHVHRVADRVANDRVRTMHAPSEAIAFSSGEHLIFLCVIEIFYIETRLLFAKGRCRQLTFAICLKR